MEIKSFILIAHVLAVTFGVGGAFMLDIYLLRHLRGAVIEEKDGTKSYWALAHPSPEPDFHNPGCFAARLP